MEHPFNIHVAFTLSEIKTDILAVICSLSSDENYSKEEAVRELIQVVQEIHRSEFVSSFNQRTCDCDHKKAAPATTNSENGQRQ